MKNVLVMLIMVFSIGIMSVHGQQYNSEFILLEMKDKTSSELYKKALRFIKTNENKTIVKTNVPNKQLVFDTFLSQTTSKNKSEISHTKFTTELYFNNNNIQITISELKTLHLNENKTHLLTKKQYVNQYIDKKMNRFASHNCNEDITTHFSNKIKDLTGFFGGGEVLNDQLVSMP